MNTPNKARSAAGPDGLAGRVAAVTGAGRGLGRACAEALANAGTHVLLMSRTESELSKLENDIGRSGGKATALPCDVTDPHAVSRVFAGLERIDILVNNAGTNRPGPFLDTALDDLDAVMNLNVRAAFCVAQAAARIMAANGGGVIVNMSSQMGHVGAAGRSVYCMTKHAVEGLKKALAIELAPMDIRVNAVAPTFAETSMTRPFLDDPDFKRTVIDRIPQGRMVSPKDVANAVCFLASPLSNAITGHSLLVDGGWTAQ
jgi:NAD(P)-dependent dehydrogenase (short-subunit alcohol dehydrogenase family)